MKPREPHLEERRAPEFAAELHERARAWIPTWGLADGERDFGRALLDIAARFSSEVAERLDRAGEKMQRGFLDWLAVRGHAARPARMPVVFKLAGTARDPVYADAPVRMQVDAGGGVNVVFETEKDVRLIPGSLQVVVGVDADADAFYLPPPGLSNLEPLEPLPAQWQLKSFAAIRAEKLQLDPEAGLVGGMVIEAAGQQFQITEVDKEIVTIDPPLTGELDTGTIVRKVMAFAPFDGKTRNRQEHALYIGHNDLLDIEAPAMIAIVGAQQLIEDVSWEYWGKVDGREEDPHWQSLTLADKKNQRADAIVLTKPKGTIEPFKVGEIQSRWIRARTKTLPADQKPLSLENLRIQINAIDCDKDIPCNEDKGESPAAEGMANTTPLVMESPFLPLGREPRQFDAFYLASAEAFSKPGAKVQLCFNMADPSFESLAVDRSGFVYNQVLAGVAGDGHLYMLYLNSTTGELARYNNRGPLRPPSPGKIGAIVPGAAVPLDERPNYRPAVWTSGLALYIAVAAGSTVWAWHEIGPFPAFSGWENFGSVEQDIADSTKKIAGIVHLDDNSAGQLYALREQKLYVRDLNAANPTWELVTTKDGPTTIELESIVAIGVENAGGYGPGTLAEGLVGVDKNQALYAVTFAGGPLVGACTKLLNDVTKDVAPAAFRRLDNRLVAAGVDKNSPKLVGFLSTPGTLNQADTDEVPLDATATIGHSIDMHFIGGRLFFALSLQVDAQSTAVARWTPFESSLHAPLYTTAIPSSVGTAGGSPTLMPTHVVVPAASSQVLVSPFDPNDLLTINTTLEAALIASTLADQLSTGDQVAIPDNSVPLGYALLPAPAGIPRGGETLYEFAVDSVDDDVFVYRAGPMPYAGTIIAANPDQLQLDAADGVTDLDMVLLIETDTSTDPYLVINIIDPIQKIVQLHQPLNTPNPNTSPANYKIEISGARLVPLLKLDPNTTGNWQASLLGRTYLIFPEADPERQRGTAFQTDPNGRPILVSLGQHWTIPPPHMGSTIEFLVDATVGEWTAFLGDSSSNPALSWEYGNGTSWWKLDAVHDETLNLKQSGAVRFVVPDDLRPMDWSGRTNYWIRARLIGGDYGKEKVTVKTTPTGNPGETTQTIERSSEGIRAPSVVRLHISYRLCRAVLPNSVLTQDSGSLRDQSDANKTRGAIVEAFVPIANAMGRFSGPVVAVEEEGECPPPCECGPVSQLPGRPAETPRATAQPRNPVTLGRSLFIGLNATPSGAPVNVLLLVEQEKPHERFAPMKIEALIADRFVPIVAEDATRALGESGLLQMTFEVPPTPRELFGVDNLTWLRLTPGGASPAAEWKPELRGAYLNAAWASAAETLTRELLGSSQGAPNLTVFLARPPVLENTLELRVREPLGEEERQALREGDERRVLSNPDGLIGDWVLWERVIDPLDEPPTKRGYALDESIGEVRFGDGQHGMIPPIGLDSIVAFSYRRTERGAPDDIDVPANGILARTPLNLVSPVETVEAVVAADRAAGGAPPESAERVVRFGTARLRHRNRAVTARDFEDLALESSPDIVQARCFVGRARVRLVVVMRGEKPIPDAAEVRELRRLLLASASAPLGAPDALRIEGPSIRRVRVVLALGVAGLDVAGDVGREVQTRIRTLFDTATWPLGANPVADDIALALIDTPRLESLADVTLREVLSDGTERNWPDAIRSDELVMLDADGFRLQFTVVEVIS